MPDSMETRLGKLEERADRTDGRFMTVQDHIDRLDNDIVEIRGLLKNTATKEDVTSLGARLTEKIDQSINGLLRDALNAAPMKQTAIWGAVVAVATIGMLLVTLIQVNYF